MSVIRSRPPAPRKVALARTGTPLEPLARTSAALGVEVLVKRDDLTGAELTGNKVRKLEYLLAEAEDQGADTVITCGGEQSNHCRATALAAARRGLACRLVLRTDDPAQPPATTGNLPADRRHIERILELSEKSFAADGALAADDYDVAQGAVNRIVRMAMNAEATRAYFRAVDARVGAFREPWQMGESRFIANANANANAAGTMQHRRAYLEEPGRPNGRLVKRWPAGPEMHD